LIQKIYQENLTKLSWSKSCFLLKKGDLPNSLINLKFGVYSSFRNANALVDQSLEPGILPDNLLSLDTGDVKGDGFTYNSFPSTLTELKVGFQFKHELLSGHLPPNLTSLSFEGSNNSNHLDHSILPNTLINLDLGCCKEIIPKLLPSNLKN
jgi:hypothetical protein